MDPVAFHLGPLSIRWYGILFALGFAAGYALLQARAKRSRIGGDRAADLVFVAAFAGLAGARLWYVIQFWPAFRGNLAEIVRIDHGGLVFYGGFLAAGLALLGFCHWKKLPKGEVADLLAPTLALAHAFGRVGCFLNGCCHGHRSDSFLAFSYGRASDVFRAQAEAGLIPPNAAAALPVLPVQLFEAAFNLLLAGTLLWAERRLPRRGQLFALYLAAYAAGRFFIEFGRGDHADFIGPFTPAQALALPLFPAALGLFLLLQRHGERRPAE
ncbi:MAG: prolipoprotein diacylglyceryl transferase [Lentisphaeria bacterium]|jgi:phosphatidylglycerol:prolipoprotein diacylglycerol transferase